MATILSRKEAQGIELQQLWEGEVDWSEPQSYITATGDILWMDKLTLQSIGSKHIVLKNGYPQVSIKGKYILLHHLVMGKPPTGMVTDHINRNSRDCRRSNLRFVTPRENTLNSERCSGAYIPTELEVRMKATEDYFRKVVIQCQGKEATW